MHDNTAPDPDQVAAALTEAGERFAERPLLTPLPGGASRDSWLVATDRQRYVLKRDPLHERSPLTSRRREYLAARSAAEAGVPVPRPVCFEPAGGRFGSAGMLSEFVPGTASPNRIQTLDPAGSADYDLVRAIGRAAGRLAHAAVLTDHDPAEYSSAAVASTDVGDAARAPGTGRTGPDATPVIRAAAATLGATDSRAAVSGSTATPPGPARTTGSGPARMSPSRDAAADTAAADVPNVSRAVGDSVGSVLAELAGGLDFLAPDRPVLATAYRWLELNRPTVSRTVLVHGDFRLGNFMVGETGLTGVIDWEFAGPGYPGQDLGFFCLRPWRFERDTLRAGGLGELPRLLDGYAETAPEPLDAATVAYWEIVGQLRWGLYCLMQERTYRQGVHRHLERFAIGRRMAEVEWDLMDLLAEMA
ncbi:phosphotransferase family protein [Nocardia crassostreae]|uniref:phosphotransferase family protein n=1 Tax=Nocardia crassostreae TaxID=53428 RepID=UPI000829520E|nr:phosphotransferase family protein [Nocardia crassostreae]